MDDRRPGGTDGRGAMRCGAMRCDLICGRERRGWWCKVVQGGVGWCRGMASARGGWERERRRGYGTRDAWGNGDGGQE